MGGQPWTAAFGETPPKSPVEIVLHVNEELWNARNPGVLEEYVAPSVDYSTPYSMKPGRKGLAADAEQYYQWAESSTSHFTAYAENGEDVFLRWESESAPRGATRLYNSSGIDYYLIRDGKIIVWKTAHERDSTAANKQRAAAIVEELWNKRDLSAIDRYFAPDVESIFETVTLTGKDPLKKGARAYFAGWSNSNTRITHLVAEGESVTIRWVTSATHSGPYAGLQPTGKTVSYSGSDFYRFEEGRVVETWTFWDRARVMDILSSTSSSD
ncbi:MAG TPA: ester cyclase [Oceanipulchritudo sp.]|nr:ester cyclase [Oceanipulchritudo sp.]